MKLRTTRMLGLMKAALGSLFAMSLLVSSISACTCSHHSPAQSEEESACHSHSSQHEHEVSTIDDGTGDAITDTSCYCVQPPPQMAAKPDKKQFDLKPGVAPRISVEPLRQAIGTESSDNFTSSQFKTSSLRISSQGRAPPRPNFG